jgi:hypothetical protein
MKAGRFRVSDTLRRDHVDYDFSRSLTTHGHGAYSISVGAVRFNDVDTRLQKCLRAFFEAQTGALALDCIL